MTIASGLGRSYGLLAAVLFLAALACRERPKITVSGGSAASPVQTAANEKPVVPLKIGYSDWPGWVAWQVALEKGFFKEAGVEVAFVWSEYVPSIEAFSEGRIDAVCMTNGDALVAGSSEAASVGIVINDYSNGNDMIVAGPGIDRMSDLRSKKIAVEVGFVDHLLLMEGLRTAELSEADVNIVDAKTHETPSLLKAGSVDAIAAWQPNSGRALAEVPGAKAIFTSADVPGLIYDLLFVSPRSLAERRSDWKKVVRVWFRVTEWIGSPLHRDEAARIMGAKVGLSREVYEKLMNGTRFLGLEENQRRFRKGPGFGSVQGSSEIADRFNVTNRVYKESLSIDPYFDPSLVEEVSAGK